MPKVLLWSTRASLAAPWHEENDVRLLQSLGLFSVCAGLWSCEQANEGEPAPESGGWGAACRPVAQSPFAQAMDGTGDRFLIGHYLDLDHSSNVELLVTGDGGRTFRPVVADYDRPGDEGVVSWRFDGSFRGFWLGERHVFVAVGGEIVSEIFNSDWMATSEDGGLSWTHRLREPGVFEVETADGTRFSGDRRWRVGDAVVVSDGASHFGSLDGGATFARLDLPTSRLAGDESGLGKWRDEVVEIGVEYRRGDDADYTAPYPIVWTRLDTGASERHLVDFGGLPVVEVSSILHRGEASLRAIVELTRATDTHDHYLLCDIAPGRPFSLAPRAPLVGLAKLAPGELGVYARGSHPGSTDHRRELHMAVTRPGHVYITTEGLVQLADTQAAWIRHLDNPARELLLLEAPFFVTETLMSLLYTSDDLRRTGAVTWDLGTAKVFSEGIEPYRAVGTLDQVGRATRSMGWAVVNRGPNGSVELRVKAASDDSTEARTFAARTFISGRHLIQVARERSAPDDSPDNWIRVSDAISDRVPDPRECIVDVELAGCAVLEDVEAKVVLTDRDGRLFALDITKQRLLVHRPELGRAHWDVLVDGLHRPRDFELRMHQGRTFALILDGEILAVDTASSGTITRSIR